MQDSVCINGGNACDLSQPNMVFIFALIAAEFLIRSSGKSLFTNWAFLFHVHFCFVKNWQYSPIW